LATPDFRVQRELMESLDLMELLVCRGQRANMVRAINNTKYNQKNVKDLGEFTEKTVVLVGQEALDLMEFPGPKEWLDFQDLQAFTEAKAIWGLEDFL
jgi:hypothetical protein